MEDMLRLLRSEQSTSRGNGMAKKSMMTSAQDTFVDAANAGVEGVKALAGSAAGLATSAYESAKALVVSEKKVVKKKVVRKVKKLAKKAKAKKKLAKKMVRKAVKRKRAAKRRDR
jgi:hypothetical protein